MQRQSYKIAEKTDSRKIAEFLSKDGQLLLRFLEVISNTEQAVDELIDVVGKGAVEAVLLLSAQQIAGPKLQGKSFLWQRNCDEKPVHRVRVTRPFYRGVVKVDRCEIKHLGV